jgi:hypothetical protein
MEPGNGLKMLEFCAIHFCENFIGTENWLNFFGPINDHKWERAQPDSGHPNARLLPEHVGHTLGLLKKFCK